LKHSSCGAILAEMKVNKSKASKKKEKNKPGKSKRRDNLGTHALKPPKTANGEPRSLGGPREREKNLVKP